jgi:DNA-binding transcriptional LysR family regulator
MERIDDLEAFVAIVERGGQSAAARDLQRSLQSINRSLVALETSLGVSLIKRTTRQSHATEAGQAYYARVKPALDGITQARTEAADRGRALSGALRVAAPPAFARAFVVPAVSDFVARHPRVTVELKASDRPVDLLGEGFDVAVRVRRLRDSSLKARRLGDVRVGVFAARRYLERHGRPRHPSELAHHACIRYGVDGQSESWPFRIDARVQTVSLQGSFFSCNDTGALQAAVACGMGLGFGPLWWMREAIDRGDVEVVLQDYEVERMPVHAVLPPTRTQPTKVRLFVDLLAAQVGRLSL